MSSSDDVLRRGDDRHARADLVADPLVGSREPRQATRAITPWRRAACPVAAVREEQLGVAGRAEVESGRRRPRRPRAAPARPRSRGRACGRGRRRPRTRPRSGSRHLLAHLVAARPDRRADRGAASLPAERPAPTPDDAREQAAPAGVQDGDRRRAARRAASAIGRQSAVIASDRQAGLVRPEPVARLAARARLGAVHERRVHLAVEREPLGVGADRGARAAGGSRRRARRRRRSAGRG